ncbi:hypothetical protein LOTGIDRAFT_162685 [Lottia gigantea]|uniref:Uncharacterized protein n=1 Tax=Lottia gigantea TaxID=225164 RepID=V4ABD6_LOTGI|nr:hypothetical protein LOTGIDRAFT_162685 [Lottia gigantea]ESO92375.1 hypothetical protein LOTGIDRAFT_162685 [Lottia gigantea]
MCLENGKRILKKIKRSKSDTSNIIKLPRQSTAPSFRTPSYTDIVLSAIESHIIAEQTEYVDLLLNMLDVDLSMNDLSLLCGLCAKYFSLRSLDIILRLWTIPKSLLSELLLIVVIMEAKTDKSLLERIEIVQLLLESGACPNFLVDSLSDYKSTLDSHVEDNSVERVLPSERASYEFDHLIERLSMTKESQNRSCYQPLEIAVIDKDLPLLKCLVEGGASTQTSFAIHLAILKGHCDVKEYLLNIPNTYQSISSLENVVSPQKIFEYYSGNNGLLQALCVCQGSAPIQSLLRHFPNLLQCHKILTTSTVKSYRPRLFLHKELEIHKLLYQYQDKSNGHLRQLPLTKLMIQIPGNDILVNEIFVKPNQHLSGIEVDKDTVIHGACEMFVACVDSKLWEMCHRLLSTEGISIIWECLFGRNSYCICNIYRCNESTHPVLSKIIFDFISKAPMECVHLFFNGLKCVLSKMDVECLQDLVMRLKASMNESFDEDTVVDQSTVLQEIVLCIFDNLKNKHEGLYLASKLTLALPEILKSSLDWTFQKKRIPYFQLALAWKDFQIDSSKKSVCKLVNHLNVIKLEVRLMKIFQKLSSEQKNTIMDKDISLAALACIYGELHILKVCLSYLETKIKMGPLLDIAAGFGHQNIIEYLINQGAQVNLSTISSACQGPTFLCLTNWEPKIKTAHKEQVSLETIQFLYRSTDQHADPGFSLDILENSITMYYWNITRWCLDNCQDITCCTGLSKAMLIALARGPEDVCLKLVKMFDWSSLNQEEAQNALIIAIKRNDQVTDNIVKPMLNSYEFIGLGYLEQQDKHKRTFMHFVCAQGKMTIVELIFNQLTTCDNHQINQILNMPDASNATPLWYALSNHHWDMAKLLILNGCVLSKVRTIHLTRKRLYLFGTKTVLESHSRGQLALTRKGTRSCEVADRVGSNGSFFEEIYDTNRIIHKVPKDVSVLEKVNHLQRDNNMSEVKLLVDLMLQSLKQGTSLLNVAIGTSNFQLVSSILEQPLKKVFLGNIYESPVIYAIVNNQGPIWDSIAEYGTSDHLESAILRVALGDIKMSNNEDVIKKTIILNSFSKPESQSFRDLFKEAGRIVEKTSNIPCFQHIDINHAIPWDCLRNIAVDSIQCKEQFLSEPILFLSAVLGQPRLFEIIRSSCNSNQEYNKLLTKPLCDDLSTIDLILLFGSRDKMSSLTKKDNENRTECLKTISDNKVRIQNITWQIVEDQRLYNVVMPILEHILKDQPIDAWDNRVQDAIKYDYEEFVIKLSDNLIDNEAFSILVPKFICLSSLFGRTALFFYFMNHHRLFDVDFMRKNSSITWNSKVEQLSILECAIISNNLVMVKHISEKLMSRHSHLDSDAVYKALKIAYRKGNTDVIRFLERMTSNDSCLDELCLIAASNGHESLVRDLLINHKINITLTNELGFGVFDYVCIYGFEALAEMLLSKFQLETSINHIHLASSFGHIRLRTILTKCSSSSNQSNLDYVPCGWFRSLMVDNEMTVNDNVIHFSHIKKKRLCLTLENLLKNGDDRGALHYCNAAQEDIVYMMEKYYQKLPLLHLCARYNNNLTLKALLDLIKLYSTKEHSSWLSLEFKGKIPIVTAIECGNMEAVDALIHDKTYNNWKYRNGETVLHIAAKYGNEDIVRMVQSPALNSAKDNFGLIPASTAVAMGHHHVIHLLCGPEKDVHHCNHLDTNFACFDCLHNYCIGWFKCLQKGRISPQFHSVRNIYDRKKSSSGFRLSQRKRGMKAHHFHPMQKILAWRTISKSSQIINSALYTMGYPQIPVNGELFLLLSELGCEEAVLKCAIKKKIDTVVLQLLKDAKQTTQFDIPEIANLCVGYHLNDIVKWIHVSRTDITSVTPRDQSILESAYGMGNMEIVNLFEAKMNGKQRVEKLNVLRDLVKKLPFSLQYRLDPQQFKVCKIKHKNGRLSDFDIIRLLPQCVIEEIFENLNLHHNSTLVYPRTIFGKSVIVETDCIRQCTATSKLSEVDVISILFSKLIIGRYVQEISKNSAAWLKLRKIIVRCYTDQLVEPCTYIEEDILYDDVTLVQDDHSQQWMVMCSSVPQDILPNPQFKNQVEEKLKDIELNVSIQETFMYCVDAQFIFI